jgi:hypothetical protein
MSTPLPDWATRDSFRRDPHQRHIARTNELSNLTAPAGGQVLRTPFGTGVVQPPAIRPMVAARAKFTTFPNQANDPGILLCKLLAADGTTEASAEFPVIGMEPHVLNDTLIVWQPPGGALGLAYAKRRSPFGTTQPTTQDYTYSVDSTKVVWQEFTTRQMVQLFCSNQTPNYTSLYPYTCRWWHIRDGDNYNNTTQRLGVCMRAQENNYRNYGVTDPVIWKSYGSDEACVVPALWTGEYDTSNSTPTPVFLTGYTAPTDHTDGFPDSPGFADQTWSNGAQPTDPGTSGSHPSSVGGWVQFYVSTPGGHKRQVEAYFDGRLRKIGPEI